MVNMTVVVGKKEILKYGIKALAFILILVFISKILNKDNMRKFYECYY